MDHFPWQTLGLPEATWRMRWTPRRQMIWGCSASMLPMLPHKSRKGGPKWRVDLLLPIIAMLRYWYFHRVRVLSYLGTFKLIFQPLKLGQLQQPGAWHGMIMDDMYIYIYLLYSAVTCIIMSNPHLVSQTSSLVGYYKQSVFCLLKSPFNSRFFQISVLPVKLNNLFCRMKLLSPFLAADEIAFFLIHSGFLHMNTFSSILVHSNPYITTYIFIDPITLVLDDPNDSLCFFDPWKSPLKSYPENDPWPNTWFFCSQCFTDPNDVSSWKERNVKSPLKYRRNISWCSSWMSKITKLWCVTIIMHIDEQI